MGRVEVPSDARMERCRRDPSKATMCSLRVPPRFRKISAVLQGMCFSILSVNFFTLCSLVVHLTEPTVNLTPIPSVLSPQRDCSPKRVTQYLVPWYETAVSRYRSVRKMQGIFWYHRNNINIKVLLTFRDGVVQYILHVYSTSPVYMQYE